MGVSGCGKTTVGRKLAAALNWPYHDADDYHPAANVARMAAGVPLSDADRQPWLQGLAGMIQNWLSSGARVVLGCSALKERYRITLGVYRNGVSLVYLRGSRQILEDRLAHRRHRYMPPALLDSQLEALEEPVHACVVDIARSPDRLVEELLRRLALD